MIEDFGGGRIGHGKAMEKGLAFGRGGGEP
jgi:hypothetical protein